MHGGSFSLSAAQEKAVEQGTFGRM